MKINSYIASHNGVTRERNYVDQTQGVVSGKLLERVNNGEQINFLQELKDGVIVELSEDAFAELNKNVGNIENNNLGGNALSYEEKVKLLQESIKPAQKLHRIIPNIKTNDKLEKSLEGADEKVVDAAYHIIEKNFLPHNIGDLTEEERQELIAVGMEEAKFLAGYLDDAKAKSFMEAMETIAKYGMNGKTDADGNVIYDIRWGAMVGAPDDYMSTGEMMKKVAPDAYKTYSEMLKEAHEKNDEKLLLKAVKYAIDWEVKSYKQNSKPFEDARQEQVNWQKGVNETKLNNGFTNVDRSSLQAFMDSIMQQRNTLGYTFLSDNLKMFADFLL